MKKIDQPAIEPNSSGPCVACGKTFENMNDFPSYVCKGCYGKGFRVNKKDRVPWLWNEKQGEKKDDIGKENATPAAPASSSAKAQATSEPAFASGCTIQRVITPRRCEISVRRVYNLGHVIQYQKQEQIEIQASVASDQDPEETTEELFARLRALVWKEIENAYLLETAPKEGE